MDKKTKQINLLSKLYDEDFICCNDFTIKRYDNEKFTSCKTTLTAENNIQVRCYFNIHDDNTNYIEILVQPLIDVTYEVCKLIGQLSSDKSEHIVYLVHEKEYTTFAALFSSDEIFDSVRTMEIIFKYVSRIFTYILQI